MALAPVALFVFRRPDHTRRMIESLLANPEASRSEVVVFADGPRTERDTAAVEATRAVIRNSGIPNLRLVEHGHNMGLAASVTAGVTELCEARRRVIVLEDDLVLAPTFLRFMNDALDRYRDDERVYAVSGYMFPVETRTPPDALFLPFPTSWGWATWDRAWQHLASVDELHDAIGHSRALRRRFDLEGSYPYWQMLKALRAGTVDSWAIRWNGTVFLRKGVSLFPARSLVTNAGFDGSGVHCRPDGSLTGSARAMPHRVETFPEAVAIDEAAYRSVKRLFRRDHGRLAHLRGFMKSHVSSVRRLLGRLAGRG